MLINLYIKDFGIIEKTEVNFIPGLNVLTGETGAGKSIIIEAIKVAAGGRALTEYVRSGCDRALVQATAEASGMPELSRLMEESGVPAEQDGLLILTREINRNGRNTCRVNGQIVTLSLYREIGGLLVDIQGQHDQQMLFEAERQLFLLDQYGGEALSAAGAEVAGLCRKTREIKSTIAGMREKLMEWTRRQDIISYQINDIDGASLQPGEDGELEAEKRRLANAEKISAMAGECYRQLYGGGETAASSVDLAGSSLKTLDRLVDLDGSLSGVRDAVAEALYRMEEACRDLAAYIDGVEFNPARLEFVEERIDLLSRLKKKYGQTIEDILMYRGEIAAELADLEGGEQKLESLERDLSSLEARLAEKADILSGLRRQSASALERDIARELQDLEMPGASFSIVFTGREQISEKGREKAEFFISTNPGEPLKPLSRIASGGETSRLMLAVKSILAEAERIPTIVFDEIDTGIGGRTIRSVAIKLRRLSEKRQVICVTHSPAVASMAVNHLLIKKSEDCGRTTTGFFALDRQERLEELARMLGGGQSGETALNHASQLMEEAKKLEG